LAIGIAIWVRRPTVVASSTESVAVLPFDVRGLDAPMAGGLAYLLSNSLDGAGELQSIDPAAVISAAERAFRTPAVSPEVAERFVKRWGARYFVLSSAVGSSTLTLNSKLYDVSNPSTAIASGAAEGPIDSLQVLIDSLTIGLLANRVGATHEFRKAASTATSSAAFRQWIIGEAHFRAGRYDSAVSAFNRAVKEDPNFALGYYRLSAAAEWNFDYIDARTAADKAAELADSRLSEQDAMVLTAWVDFLKGNANTAERNYRRILVRSPANVEARSGLAEVLVHYNPIRGLTIAQAKREFDILLESVPEYGEARYHALEFATRDRNRLAFDTLLRDMSPRNPQASAWRTVRAFVFGTVAEQNAVLTALDTASNETIGIAALRLAAHAHEFDGATRITRKLLRPGQPEEWRAVAHIFLASLALARGDGAAAQKELALAEPFERDWTRELGALFLLHPAVNATQQQIRNELKKLEEWKPGDHSPAYRNPFLAIHATEHAALRIYLLGLLNAAVQDTAAAQRFRRELQSTSGRRGQPEVSVALAQSLQGHIAFARGDLANARRLLLSVALPAPPEFLASPFFARSHDRWTIARISRQLGETAEAERWERSLNEGFDFPWTAIAK
jgi:tetratricopeptide (TPR) repeat protein